MFSNLEGHCVCYGEIKEHILWEVLVVVKDSYCNLKEQLGKLREDVICRRGLVGRVLIQDWGWRLQTKREHMIGQTMKRRWATHTENGAWRERINLCVVQNQGETSPFSSSLETVLDEILIRQCYVPELGRLAPPPHQTSHTFSR